MNRNRQGSGVILAIAASIMWGVQGPISQFLFQNDRYSPEWLMGVKMPIAGILILLFTRFVQHQPVMKLWKSGRKLIVFFLYTFFGLAAVQYLYLLSVQKSNAGTATIMQSLGTIIIIILTAIIYRQLPDRNQIIAVLLALIGTWLLVTKGNLNHLAITPNALGVGLLLALAGALQTMLPVNLLKYFSATVVIGWAMVVGGLVFAIHYPIWHNAPQLTLGSFLGISFIVIFGTMMSFICFVNSLKYISPTVAGMLDTFEPLSATLGAIWFLNTSFNGYEVMGGLLILSTVFIIALPTKTRKIDV